MLLSDLASEPISVDSPLSGTRWERSPAAIFAAVFSIRLSGLKVRCTTNAPKEPPSSTTAMLTMMQNRVNVLITSIWSPSERPIYTMPRSWNSPLPDFVRPLRATTRQGHSANCMVAWSGTPTTFFVFTTAGVVNGTPSSWPSNEPLSGSLGLEITPSLSTGCNITADEPVLVLYTFT